MEIVYLLVISSTFGQGESPLNGKEFETFMTTWLSKEIPQLKNIHFAVFGLGSSNYTEFGKFPKKINSFFKGLGMTELIELVIAD